MVKINSIMPSLNHIHQYGRFPGRPSYVRCLHSECTHSVLRKLIVNKQSLCNKCGTLFILQWKDLRLARPLGPCCSMRKEDIALRERTKILKELFQEENEKVIL